MTYISGTQLCIYVTGLALVLFLLGIVGSNYITFDNSDNPFSDNVIENLDVPSISSSRDVSSGASELYGWGYTPIPTKHKTHVKKSRRCPSCENTYSDNKDICILCQGGDKDCRFADITQNVNIDKYVLKSSIPPCPDLTEYAKKNQIPPYPFNKNDWVLKSAIPPCPPAPNLDDYIRKSEVPNCIKQECAQCPIAPICPVVPPCRGDKIKVIKKTIYKDRPINQEIIDEEKYGYLPNNINYYPGSSVTWTPKLSELNEGFISPEEFMAPSLHMARSMDCLPKKI